MDIIVFFLFVNICCIGFLIEVYQRSTLDCPWRDLGNPMTFNAWKFEQLQNSSCLYLLAEYHVYLMYPLFVTLKKFPDWFQYDDAQACYGCYGAWHWICMCTYCYLISTGYSVATSCYLNSKGIAAPFIALMCTRGLDWEGCVFEREKNPRYSVDCSTTYTCICPQSLMGIYCVNLFW